MELNRLSVLDIKKIHELLTEEFSTTQDPIFPEGVKNIDMLESAVSRQYISFNNKDKYPDPIDNAATLTFGLCCNHPFHNGNKRTALVSCLAHLEKNKLIIRDLSDKQLEEMILHIATHSLVNELPRGHQYICKANPHDSDVMAISYYLKPYIHNIKRGERPITYKRLEEILNRHGFVLKNQDARHVEIYKREQKRSFFGGKINVVEKKITAMTYHGVTKSVSCDTLKHVREKCNLREEDGCDSNSFYNDEDIVSSFINKYRKILYRLANK